MSHRHIVLLSLWEGTLSGMKRPHRKQLRILTERLNGTMRFVFGEQARPFLSPMTIILH